MVGAEDAADLAADLVGPGAVVTREGAGWDHVAWRVVGRDGIAWIVRAASSGEPDVLAAEVRREVAVMQRVRAVLGDLVGDAVVLDPDRAAMAHPRLPGTPLQDLLAAGRVPTAELDRLAREIGAIVRTIGAVAPPDDVSTDDRLPAYVSGLAEHVADIDHLLSSDQRAAVDRFLATPPPADPDPRDLCLAHNDLGAEHVLVDPGSLAITGIIDWSDAARADQAAEVGRLLRDVGGAHLDAVLDGMQVTGTQREAFVARGWCYARCLVLEDLAYAVGRRPDLVAFEHASLAVLFADI